MRLTKHALVRMTERGIRPDDVELALWYGRRFRQGNKRIYVLAKQGFRFPDHLPSRLHALVVIAANDDVVITTFRCHRRDPIVRYEAAAARAQRESEQNADLRFMRPTPAY